ncbi:MAG: hypothetical protein F4Z04_08525 [Acidobacteria bacterium]|nr:hypothetical protein [Acidobacteriota bacterium]
MRKRTFAVVILAGLLAALAAPAADARVVRIEVEQTRPYAGGREFGDAGPFERLDGTVHMEVDPDDPLNAVVVNLDRAPRNEQGMVEFSAPFFIIKPVDMARGNQKVLYGINNRGNAIELGFQTFPPLPPGADPESGDGLFFRLGYTLVDAGWAGDVTTTPTRLGANLPVALQADGSPIVSRIRIEYPSDPGQRPDPGAVVYTLPLKGNDRFVSYETADTDTGHSALTVRDAIDGERRPVPADGWAFGKCPSGDASLAASTTDICLFDGFDPDKIYELVYPARNPWVMGLGYAVTRDVASFLRYQTVDDAGTPNPIAAGPEAVGIRRVYGLGISSTGMYLRDYLYLGFNEDEAHRRVFDAVRIHIPGTHRLFANVEFADPNIYSRQDRTSDFTSQSYPPLTYAVTTDPVTNIRDGILKRPATDPLVFHVDTSNEFWQMKASLNVHDGHGNPVPNPDNVRLYLLASHPHGGAAGVAATPTNRGACEHVTNSFRSSAPASRALIVALDAWADRGIEPPASNYPDVRRGTLATVDEVARTFPAIPGVTFPTRVNGLNALGFGPTFGSQGGRQTVLPPTRGGAYQVLVPTTDRDGHDVAGIRTIDIAAPVGTNTGWNLYAAGPRGRDLCGLTGSFFPFARTRAEREANGDPRLSLEERYGDHAGFVAAVRRAADESVARRILLPEDADVIVRIAEESDILQ